MSQSNPQADREAATLWTLHPQKLDDTKLKRSCLSWLDRSERTRYEAFNDPWRRHDFLAAHALCRAALAKTSGVSPADLVFRRGRFGKPRLSPSTQTRSLHFNLTHTAGLACCVVTRSGPVGIDAERADRTVDIAQVAKHFHSLSAQAILSNLPVGDQQRWFYQQWVLREALLKARGIGLAAPPDAEPIALGVGHSQMFQGRWRLSLFEPEPAVMIATAIRCQGGCELSIDWMAGEDLFLSEQV